MQRLAAQAPPAAPYLEAVRASLESECERKINLVHGVGEIAKKSSKIVPMVAPFNF